MPLPMTHSQCSKGASKVTVGQAAEAADIALNLKGAAFQRGIGTQ
jgi:hypothetical protein